METQSEPKKRNWRGSVLRIVVLSTLIAGIGAPILWQQLAAYESEGGLASVPSVELPVTAKLKENFLAHMAVDQPIVFSDYEQVYGDPPAAGLAPITDPGLLSRRMVFGERTYVGAPLSTPWKTNNQFLIHRIVGDLWLFTEFARKGTIEGVDLSKIEVRETAMDPYDIKTLRFDYRIVGHPELGDWRQLELVEGQLLNPKTWFPLLESLGLEEAKPGNQVGELEPLEDFLASIRTLDNVSLIKANRRLSDYLTQNPLDVNAHARAVILVEAMMGYEDLIHLFERHFYWNRVTFHQAIQEYLLSKNFTPAEISWEVKLSDVHSKYIRTDYIQSTKAFETLFVEYPEFIKPEYDFLEYLNVSSDKENKGRDAEGNLSSNIRIALAEARVQREGEFSGQFFDKLLKNKYDMPHVSPELSFRFMIALQPTVSLGHFVNNRAIKMETDEFTESLNAYYGTTHSNGDAKELAVFWNAAPKEVIGLDEEKKLSLKVIDWGMWAHLHQRQLINAMEKEYKFWSQSFSDPDRASALLSDLEDSFSDLYLFSYFHFLNVQPMNEKYRTNFATGLRDTPELFPPAAWLTENWTVSQAPDKNYQDDPKRKGFSENPERIRYFWFSSPPGSLFKVLIYRHPKDDMNDLWNRRLAGFYPPQKKKAPVIIYMDSIYLNNGALPTAEQKQEYLKEVLANIKDNNKYPTLVYQVIDQYKNQEEFTWLTSELWKILLEKDSSMLYQYLWNNWALIPEDDFAKYGEQMFRETSDRVAVSHLMLPLVILHYHRGEMSLVKRYANEGERVYSYDGLMAASVAYVMQKNYKQALETYEAIQNRYEQEGRYFDSFLLKAPEQFIESKGYGDRRRKVIAEAFPQGMDKITEIPQAPPTKGVRILSLAEDAPADLPLKPEDIIIAIGGYPYYEANQYQHLRYLNFFHNFRVMLWRPSEQKYHEFLISYPQRRLFCNVETWPLAPQPADAAPPATP